MKNLLLTIGLPAVLFVTGAVAQDPHDMSKMSGECNMMMSHMNGMMAGHGDAAKIVDELQKNVVAMQAEKKSGPLKEKLAAQAAMLKDLQAKLDAQSHMMGNMPGMQHDGKMMPGCCDTPKK